MNTFSIILQKNIGIEEIIYDKKDKYNMWENIYKNESNIDSKHFLIYYYLFSSFKSKFEYLDSVLNNIFINTNQKDEFIDIFSKSQMMYYSFVKLANIYKFKKAKLVISIDLCMNHLTIENKHVIQVMHNNSKYLFLIFDLIKIFNNSLSNCSSFFPKPFIPKNPYNNMNFNNSTIYNIYFFIKFNNYIIPTLLQAFIKNNLCLQNFVLNSEFIIRERYIKNYIFTTPVHLLYEDSIDMINEFTNNIKIDKEFPKDNLVKIFRPYLHLYYMYNYYVYDSLINKISYSNLKHNLRIFEKHNPLFGRKVIKIENNIKIVHFNLDHINFYKKY